MPIVIIRVRCRGRSLLAVSQRLGLGVVTAASHLEALSLGELTDLAVHAAPARHHLLAGVLRLVLGGITGTHLATLIYGDIADRAVLMTAAPAHRLAGLHCQGLVGMPVTSHLGTLSFGGLHDLAAMAAHAAPAFRLAVAIPFLRHVRGVVAELIGASLGEPLAFCLIRCQTVGTVAGAFEKLRFVVSGRRLWLS